MRQAHRQSGLRLRQVDKVLLPQTFVWYKRALCWCLWKTPVQRLMRLRWRSPYRRVVDVFSVAPGVDYRVDDVGD
jgi:hypothetical protein